MAKFQGQNILVRIAAVATATSPRPTSGFVSLIGRSTGFSIDGNRFEFDAEFGDVNALWRSGSTISDRGWTVPFEAYWKDTDPAFLMVEAAVMQKKRDGTAASPYLYIIVYPLGLLNGATTYSGVVTVDNFEHTFDRAGSLDSSFGFTGEGEPVIATHTAVVPVYTSRSPASGTAGTTAITIVGTGLTAVTALQLRTGSTVNATVTNFTTQTDTNLIYTLPAGLAAGAYDQYLLHIGGSVAAGSVTVS